MAENTTQKEAVTRHFSKEELAKMSVNDLIAIIGEAGPDAKFHGKAVVRRADGSIKYDDERLKGNYDEL